MMKLCSNRNSVVKTMLKTSAEHYSNARYRAVMMQVLQAIYVVAFTLLPLKDANSQASSQSAMVSKEAQAESPSPLSKFEQLTSSSWTVTASSGTKMVHTWKWGPGKQSIERWTSGESAKGDPWIEAIIYYWHPQSKKIRFLGVSPFASGINVGEINFDGSTAVADSILTQTSGRREMQTKWQFITKDKYVETLMERDPSGKLLELVSFEHRREEANISDSRAASSLAPDTTQEFAAFKSLLGGSWIGRNAAGKTIRISLEWIAVSNFIHGTISMGTESTKAAENTSVFLYRKTNSKTISCLALSSNSAVYEGEVITGQDGNLQAELTCTSTTSIDSLSLLTERVSEQQIRQTIRSKQPAGSSVVLTFVRDQ